MFWFFFAIVVFIFYIAGKFINKKFTNFLSISNTRRMTWEWTKRLFFIFTIPFLLVATFQRWYYFHDEMEYSGNPKQLDPSYASQIEVQSYLMNVQNVIDLFEGKPPNPDMQIISENSDFYYKQNPSPSDPRFYLVFRFKNNGDRVAWGVLDHFVEGKKLREIDVPSLPSHMSEFKNIVFQANFIDQNIPGSYPHLETKWKLLFTQGEKP